MSNALRYCLYRKKLKGYRLIEIAVIWVKRWLYNTQMWWDGVKSGRSKYSWLARAFVDVEWKNRWRQKNKEKKNYMLSILVFMSDIDWRNVFSLIPSVWFLRDGVFRLPFHGAERGRLVGITKYHTPNEVPTNLSKIYYLSQHLFSQNTVCVHIVCVCSKPQLLILHIHTSKLSLSTKTYTFGILPIYMITCLAISS